MESIFERYLRSNRHFMNITNEHVKLCESIAEQAHASHTRWNGESYKNSHLTRINKRLLNVSDKFLYYMHEENEKLANLLKCVAWLHDVLEDCRDEGFDSHYLLAAGVPLAVVQEVRHLTRLPSESYLPYIIRLCNSNSPIVMTVKLLDIEDNLSDLDTYPNTERHRDCYELSRYIIEDRWTECNGGVSDLWI